ncbi:hypothetical protein ACLOJK_015753 [Asimina triloba]
MCEDTHVAPSPTSRDDDEEEEPSSESELRERYLDKVDMSEDGGQWNQAIASALRNLRRLSMYRCNLSGTIHPIFGFRFLSKQDLGRNNFSSMLLHSHGHGNLSSVMSLTMLSLYHCNMSGSVPSRFANLAKLKNLDLSQPGSVHVLPVAPC